MNKTKTTAYALNELHGKERDVFESDLAADADLQRELQSTSRVADALEQIMVEPREGLEPQARERLIRAIAENQRIFHQRRKIVRFAVPVSLAAAASIALLLLVSGGTTTQGPAVAAASVPEAESTIAKSLDARAIDLMHAVGMPTPGQPQVRQRSLLSSEEIPLWGGGPQGLPWTSMPVAP
jgi:anti-sigma factor RsiW